MSGFTLAEFQALSDRVTDLEEAAKKLEDIDYNVNGLFERHGAFVVRSNQQSITQENYIEQLKKHVNQLNQKMIELEARVSKLEK